MKLSIIIPVYNTPKLFLDKCIYSITNQNEQELEILIIDDGSEDKCARLCDSYAIEDSRVQVFHVKNGGVSKARNFGLERAMGEWIMFADSDDWFEETAFSVIEKNLDDQCDMLIFDSYRRMGSTAVHNHYFEYNTIFENSDIEELQIQALWKFACEGYYPEYNTVGTPWGKIIKASIIRKNKISFPVNMKIREDMVFVINALQYCNKVKYIQDELYNYRIHDESAVSIKRLPKEEYEIFNRISKEVCAFNKKFNKKGKFTEIYYVHLINETISLCRLYRHDRKKMRRIIENAPYKQALKKVETQYLEPIVQLKKFFIEHKNYNMFYLIESFIEVTKKMKHILRNKLMEEKS